MGRSHHSNERKVARIYLPLTHPFSLTISVNVTENDIPEEFMELANAKRAELFEHLAEVDEAMSDMFIMEENPTSEQLAVG